MENSSPKISVLTPTIRPAGLRSTQAGLGDQTFTDFEWLVEVGFPDKSDLNAALNRLARRAKGELLVFLQDYILIKPDGLQKFWDAYQRDKNTFFTAAVNNDWRIDAEPWTKRPFMDWEIDWGACPREALVKIGGFDEALDEFWGFDNVNAGLRAEMARYDIVCIDNPAIGMRHDEAPMKKNRNEKFHNQRLDEIRRGLRVDYLT